jgi:hypothetical protein
MIIDPTDPQIESKLLSQERIYDDLRMNGVAAPATVLRFVDTGIRIGENASMLQFSLMVFPHGQPPFQADSQTAVLDSSRPKFTTDATIFVKFDPKDLTQVAIDHAEINRERSNVVVCSSCGATQSLAEGQSVCSFCGSPI